MHSSEEEERRSWNEKAISEFYDLNKKGMKDRELAVHFQTTIPTVYYIRRKLKLSTEFLNLQKLAISKKLVVKHAIGSEAKLRSKVKVLRENTKVAPEKNN